MPTIVPSVAAHVMVTGSLSASEEQDTRNAGKSEREEEGVRKGEGASGKLAVRRVAVMACPHSQHQ